MEQQQHHKRCADDALACTPSRQSSRKRRAVDDAVKGRPVPILTAQPLSPPVGCMDVKRSTSVEQTAATASSSPATPIALSSLPSNGLLQAYDPLHVRTQHLPYVPLRVAHVHSTAIAHHDQPIYLSKLQDCRDRQPRNQQRTPSHSTQRRPHLPQYALLTSASDHEQRHSRARQSRQSQPDGGELLTSTAEQLVLSTASPSPFTRRTSAERTSAAPLDVSALLLPPDITDSQQSMATDDTIPPDILSPTFSSQSSLLPTILTPPRAASQQRRSSSLLSLSLSSSSSFSSSSTGPLAPPVSRSLSFQLPSSSSFVSALACTLSYFSPAPTFDAMTEDGLPPTTETNPPLLVTPPPLVSKKTAPHFRMANRTQQPQLICPTLTPSKEEQQLEPVDGSGKENATPASVTRKQHTPRSHKDLFAVKTPSARRQAVSLGGSARVHETRGIEWLNEERASAMRRLRSMR